MALLSLSPLLLLVIILLRFTGEGEVFFHQPRVGKAGRTFKLWKFATMLKDSPSMGTGTVTIKNDPRILPFGNLLRKTKVNELPQLVNILLGDMSFVGPRPQTQRCFDVFPKDLQKVILQMKPGLSGVGPVIFRGEEDMLTGRTDLNHFYDNILSPYKAEVEAWYNERQNIFNYFAIIFLTIWVVLFPKSQAAWKIFVDIPVPPDILKKPLNFKD